VPSLQRIAINCASIMKPEIPFPAQRDFFWAVLRVLADASEPLPRDQVREAVADVLRLTAEQRADRLHNLTQLRYRHRAGWSLSILKAAGYTDDATCGLWSITDLGRSLIVQQSEGLDDQTYRRIVAESRHGGPPAALEGASSGIAASQTPEERIEAAEGEIVDVVRKELLDRIGRCTPAFFEQLVLDLLVAMGYGSSKGVRQRTGGPGDGGIDGVIAMDRLGLDKVCLQAKRWQGTVGRPEVQAFYGALAGRKVRKGVFITTSAFSRDAIDYAAHVADAIVLVDGDALAGLMIEHGVGVRSERIVRIPQVDETYFEQ
jgi:restriction system protein